MPDARLQRTREVYDDYPDDVLARVDAWRSLFPPITDEFVPLMQPNGETIQVRVPRKFEVR